MKLLLLFVALCVSTATAFGGRVSNDALNYTPPGKGWKTEVKAKHYTSYSITNKATRAYCQIFVLLGTNSKGDIAADFDNEWKMTILSSYKVTSDAQVTETETEAGWQAKAGVASFEFDGSVSVAMLTTITGYNRTVSIVAVTNSDEFTPAIQSLLGSVKMNKQVAAKAVAKPAAKTAKPTALQGYMEYSPYTKTWTWRLRTPQQ